MPSETDPTAPNSLPKYLAEGLPKQDNATLRCDRIRRGIDREALTAVTADELDDDGAEVEEQTDSGTIVTKMLTCGDVTCHCMTDDEKHGPYRYRVYRDDRGKVTADYLGKA